MNRGPSHLGEALLQMERMRSTASTDALTRVRRAEDPLTAMAELSPECLEYVELALLTTMTTCLCADRRRGISEEAIAARARTIPAPLYDRLQAMVKEQWPAWRPPIRR